MRHIPELGINHSDIIELKKILWVTHTNRTGVNVGYCSCGATSDGWPNKPCETVDLLLQLANNLNHLIQDYKKGDLDSILKSLDFYANNPQKEG